MIIHLSIHTSKRLLYTPGYGLAAFTVPQFDRCLLRSYVADSDRRAST